MSRRKQCVQMEFECREDALLHRARRLRERGNQRRAMMTLRELCYSESSDARLWTLYAVQCVRAGRRDDAERALVQAVWLRERGRDARRAEVTRALLVQLRAGQGELRAA